MTGIVKVCAVTGTRADYGPLMPILLAIKKEEGLQLQIVATGSHLSARHGLTYQAIEADGLEISETVDILDHDADDSSVEIAKAVGRGFHGFSEAYNRLQPDFVLLLGDRYELIAAAGTALIMRIPIAHVCGGDVTEGAFDEAIRHSITKMSALHFVTNADAARRIRQLGEDPNKIFLTGNPALDFLTDFSPLDRAALEARLQFKLRNKNLLTTFHPVTLEPQSSVELLDELLEALDQLDSSEFGIIFTLPNSDTEGLKMIERIVAFAESHENVCAHPSLGQHAYYSAITHADAVVGNSSSGIYEVPSFKKPTVNIGDREKGRIRAASVIDVAGGSDQIHAAIIDALELDCSAVVSPYGDGTDARRIADVLKSQDPGDLSLTKKEFHNLPVDAL